MSDKIPESDDAERQFTLDAMAIQHPDAAAGDYDPEIPKDPIYHDPWLEPRRERPFWMKYEDYVPPIQLPFIPPTEDERLAAERHAIDNPVEEELKEISAEQQRLDDALFESFSKEDNRTAMLSWVFRNANIEALNVDGHTPIMRACALGREKCVEALLENSANAHASEERHGWTSLHWAAHNGHANCVRSLCYVKNMNLNCETNRGFTPVMLAASAGHADALRFLLRAGASFQHFDNEERATALILAASRGRVACCGLLVDFGADGVGSADITKRTALDYARIGKGKEVIVEILMLQKMHGVAKRRGL